MINPEALLEQYLERVLSGEVTVDELRQSHPELGGEVFRLLATADRVWTAGYQELDAESLERGRRRLLDEITRAARARPSLLDRLAGAFRPMALARAAAISAVAIVLAGGGVTFAATQSEPGSVLYDYRLALEETRANLALERERPGVYLEFAEQRLDHLERAAFLGSPESVQRAGSAYTEAVTRGVEALKRAARTAPPQQVDALIMAFEAKLARHAVALELVAQEELGLVAQPELDGFATAAVDGLAAVRDLPPDQAAVADAPADRAALVGTPIPVSAALPSPRPTPELPEDRSFSGEGVVRRVGDDLIVVDGRLIALSDEGLEVHGELVAGARVRIEGVVGPDQTRIARRVEVLSPPADRPADDLERFAHRGEILAIDGTTWNVGGTPIVVDRELVPGLRIRGEPGIGGLIEVSGHIAPDGHRMATQIVVVPAPSDSPAEVLTRPASPDEPPPARSFQLRGAIEVIEPPWMLVDGIGVIVSRERVPDLVIEGELAVGRGVQVVGRLGSDGTRVAFRIIVAPPTSVDARPLPPDRRLSPEQPRGERFALRGVIEAVDRPWMVVNGVRVLVSDEHVRDVLIVGEPRIGARAVVRGLVLEDGIHVAVSVVVLPDAAVTHPAATIRSGDAERRATADDGRSPASD